MTVVTPLQSYYRPAHVDHVASEMLRRGPPQIRAYFDADIGAWFSSEGTHRLRAAERLGIPPVLISIPWWRGQKALERARFAALIRGHTFARVIVLA